jgi:hypothetical protein
MPDRSKGRGQTKYIPWSSRLGVRSVANNPTPDKSTVRKSPEPMEEDKTGTKLWRKKKKRRRIIPAISHLVLLILTFFFHPSKNFHNFI